MFKAHFKKVMDLIRAETLWHCYCDAEQQQSLPETFPTFKNLQEFYSQSVSNAVSVKPCFKLTSSNQDMNNKFYIHR